MCRPINGFTISLRQFCNTEDTPRPMLNRWFKRRQPDPEPEPHFDPITPDVPVIAIGDIHGRFDLLERLPEPPAGTQVICVGDLVDRGEQDRRVIEARRAQDETTIDLKILGDRPEVGTPSRSPTTWPRHQRGLTERGVSMARRGAVQRLAALDSELWAE